MGKAIPLPPHVPAWRVTGRPLPLLLILFFWHVARMWGSDYIQSSFVARLTTLPVTPIIYLLDDTEHGIGRELKKALIT